MNITDSISFGALVFTVISGMGIPFLQRPMLAYDYTPIYQKSDVENLQYLNITIHNMGIIKLSNIVGAFNTKVLNISSEPFIDKDLTVDYANLKSENGYFKINSLSPQTDLLIIVTLNGSQHHTNFPFPSIVSDEWRGYPTYYVYLVNILALIAAFVSAILCIYYWRKR